MSGGEHRPILCALAAAALFGASTPAAKALTGSVAPLVLAGLLYAGSGIGLTAWLLMRRIARPSEPRGLGLARAELPWLAGAVLAGGALAPALLIWGLSTSQASTVSLLLNLEGVFTAMLAWFLAAGGLFAFFFAIVLYWFNVMSDTYPILLFATSLAAGLIGSQAMLSGYLAELVTNQRRDDPFAIAERTDAAG